MLLAYNFCPHEKHMILKVYTYVEVHVLPASNGHVACYLKYIIMLYCLVYSYNILNVSLGDLAIVSLIPKFLHCTYDTMIIQFYY